MVVTVKLFLDIPELFFSCERLGDGALAAGSRWTHLFSFQDEHTMCQGLGCVV